MLWFNFVLGLISIFLCSKFIIIHYHNQKQRKIKIKPRIKLNHNIYKDHRAIALGVQPAIGNDFARIFCCRGRGLGFQLTSA